MAAKLCSEAQWGRLPFEHFTETSTMAIDRLQNGIVLGLTTNFEIGTKNNHILIRTKTLPCTFGATCWHYIFYACIVYTFYP